jgi:hypothetical protein
MTIMKKIHYVYRIINLKNNKEYIGVRSHMSPENDLYMGSSNVLNNLYRIEGVENFKKEVIKTFTTRKLAEDYESSLLTEEYCNDPNTYNIQPTGNFTDRKHGFRKDIWYDYIDEIREKYTQGITMNELGIYYGCDSGTIRAVITDIKRTTSESQKLRFQSNSSSGARNTSIDIHIPEIIDLYVNQLKSVESISSFFNVHKDVIKRRLKQNNIKLRTHKESQILRNDNRKHSKAWEHEKEIISLYNNKMSMSKIAKIYGCDGGTIKTIISKNT